VDKHSIWNCACAGTRPVSAAFSCVSAGTRPVSAASSCICTRPVSAGADVSAPAVDKHSIWNCAAIALLMMHLKQKGKKIILNTRGVSYALYIYVDF
jgi:hypothetical protein